MRIIGDVHGKIQAYTTIAKGAKNSVQLGDMGFDYTLVSKLHPGHHCFLGGNHDNYDIIKNCDNALGNYGLEDFGGLKFFYIRGAFSVDKAFRLQYDKKHMCKSWWKEEELTEEQMQDAFDYYKICKPKIVITHSCPQFITDIMVSREGLKFFGIDPVTHIDKTMHFLAKCFDVHEPELWLFGHMHRSWKRKINSTTFQCLDELEYIDL